MNILLTLCFNGAAYHGFQVQQNAHTICAEMQNAMEKLFAARPDVKGCSRTDAGVHARQFCLSFRQDTNIPLAKLPLALNGCLPPDIRALKAQQVPQDFHARYSATGKEYQYVVLNRAADDPFVPGQYYRVQGALDEVAMNKAAAHLVGRHDFAAFMAAGSTVQDTVRTVTQLRVRREGGAGEWLVFTVAADGFLYNMVRIICGTLVQVGRGKQPPEWAAAVLAGRRRENAGPTLPAKGLFLNRVFYPEDALAL